MEKSARLAELSAVLQMNEREPEVLDGDAPDEGDDVPEVRKISGRER